MLAASLVVIGLALRWTGWVPPAGRGRATLAAAVLGFGAVFVLFLGGIALSGALPAWWYQNFVWPAKWAAQVGEDNLAYWTTVYVHPGRGAALLAVGLAVLAPRLLNRWRPVFSSGRAAVYYAGLGVLLALNHAWLGGLLALPDGGWSFALPVVVLLQAALAVGQAAPARAPARPAGYHLAAALAGLSLASLTQYYPLPCSRHILWSLAPAFGLVVWSLWRWSSARALFVAGGLAAAFGPAAYDKYRWARYTLAQPLVTVTQPAVVAGMRVPAAQAEDFARIGTALDAIARRAPGTPAALLGNDALYLCFSPVLDNPGPYFVAWTELLTAAEARARWAWIYQHRPVLIFEQSKPAALATFCQQVRYTSVLFRPSAAVVVAVPDELAGTPAAPAGKGGP